MRVRWTAMTNSLDTDGAEPAEADRAEPAEVHAAGLTMADVDLIRVVGGARLDGEVSVVGAKNSALKLMAAALLAPGRTTLTNVPRITDIAIMAEVLRRLGCVISHHDDRVDVDVPEHAGSEAEDRKSTRLNSSHGSISYAVFCLKK